MEVGREGGRVTATHPGNATSSRVRRTGRSSHTLAEAALALAETLQPSMPSPLSSLAAAQRASDWLR